VAGDVALQPRLLITEPHLWISSTAATRTLIAHSPQLLFLRTYPFDQLQPSLWKDLDSHKLVNSSFTPAAADLPEIPLGDDGRSDETMNARSSSFNRSPNLGPRRPSISSRLSFAVSNAEQGEAGERAGPAEAQIEEEIAEIKRYEVSSCLAQHMDLRQRILTRCRTSQQ
jgi:hypothetical protein